MGFIPLPGQLSAEINSEGLEGFASGRFTSQAELKRFFEAHPQFPVCRHGYLTNEQVNRILTNPLYAGHLESKVWDVSLRKAQHDGMIDLETFQRNQERLFGKPLAPARADINADFPLRGFVTCGCCSHPMTANWSRGRHGKQFAYYICRHRGCDRFGKSVARDKVEGAFENVLSTLAPRPEVLTVFTKLFRKRWNEAESKAKESGAAIKLQSVAVEKKIAQLLDRIVESDSSTVIGAYERKVEELERQKLVLAEKISRCGTALPDYDETFRTAFEFISNPCILWKTGSLEDKRIVLKLALDSHLEYDWNEGVRTPELSLPFKALGDVCDQEKVMAERVSLIVTRHKPSRRAIITTNQLELRIFMPS
ncbi:Recombinase zinc beta ribbon domain-containing protein [Novosphingobium sp. CF614]|uniref:recombinase zinc beta ribbon domain-containing protein n=1 Tax=Novosphingobium sp. CF614 TaxID=1884364 RepID=UPI0008E1B920|nr:recombinase zinc beta ribbon domain-containing protein [Novosphingobium sp. CF614]SFG02234.1 Recombinase zinc beta ribbon domain-containing protein [Novosphingobium sp. CF614]